MAFDLSTKIQEESAKGLFHTVISLIKSAGKFAANEIKIRNATEKYVDNYLRRFCFIKILGMVEPVPLNELFTDVEISYPYYRIKEQIIDYLEDEFRHSNRIFRKPPDRIPGIQIANEKNKLNVLGPPGSGKST